MTFDNQDTQRQTRMLSNLELVNCYNATSMAREERDRIMLESAKENLLRMAFFGVTELQSESQDVFQRTFNMRFKIKFPQQSQVVASKAQKSLSEIKVDKIKRLNHLDVELYAFAREVLLQRYESLKNDVDDFIE